MKEQLHNLSVEMRTIKQAHTPMKVLYPYFGGLLIVGRTSLCMIDGTLKSTNSSSLSLTVASLEHPDFHFMFLTITSFGHNFWLLRTIFTISLTLTMVSKVFVIYLLPVGRV